MEVKRNGLLAGQLVLLVEDDVVQQAVIESILQEEGCKVLTASNVYEALAMMTNEPTAILSDHNMPHKSGTDLLVDIRKTHPYLPFVLMTASSELDVAFQAVKLGANEFVVKDEASTYLRIIAPILNKTITDASQQKHLAQKFAAVEAQAALTMKALNVISEAIAIFHKDGRILYRNRQFRELDDAILDLPSFETWLSEFNFTSLMSDPVSSVTLKSLIEESGHQSPAVAIITNGDSIFQICHEKMNREQFIVTLTESTGITEQFSELRKIIRYSPVATIAVDRKGQILLTNKAADELFGFTDESETFNLSEFLPKGMDHHQRLIESYFVNHSIRAMNNRRDVSLISPVRGPVPVEVTLNFVHLDGKDIAIASVVDLADRKRLETELKTTSLLYESIIDNALYSILLVSRDGDIIRSNPAFDKLIGLSIFNADKKQSLNLSQLFSQEEISIRQDQLRNSENTKFTLPEIIHHTSQTDVKGDVYWTWHSVENHEFSVRISSSEIHIPGAGKEGYLLIANDLTQELKDKEYIQHLAHHDPLTGLPNRILFMDRLEVSLARAKRQSKQVGVINIDLDGFKEVNDVHGHLAGDEVLKEVGLRLSGYVRKSDTVCRLGGDEFVILLEDIDSPIDAMDAFLTKLVQLIAKPYRVASHDIRLSGSVGVAFNVKNQTTVENIMRNADTAMYQAKKSGKNGFAYFMNNIKHQTNVSDS